MSSKIVITPKSIVSTKTCASVQIMSVSIVLFQSATVVVQLLDSNNVILNVDVLQMNTSDYTNWGANDSYLTNWVLTQLGMSVVPPVTQSSD